MFKERWLFLVCFIVVLANAAPLDKDNEATITLNNYTIDEKGNYRFRFKSSNGIERDETGIKVYEGEPNEHLLVIGQHSYFNEKGEKVSILYSADETGYHILPPGALGTVTSGVPGNVVATLLG
ncbi:larval cuticle protein 16/17-like [Bicyclus anynana]|uniref:Larval cuticle protein 16/17-like n=1 Tax=Bicyclus anynana TaxID=110368 RepID=A0ABM3LHT4_BICAN|nr:larval cuticle protein 16/17-like [Bicyclus anynana]